MSERSTSELRPAPLGYLGCLSKTQWFLLVVSDREEGVVS